MSTRWPREMFGVKIIYLRDHIARKAVSVVTGGRNVWALLPDGTIGTNDAQFFKYSCGKGTRVEAQVAEKLWRLGKVKKSVHQDLEKALRAKDAASHKRSVASGLKHYAKEVGLKLSTEQTRLLEKIAAH